MKRAKGTGKDGGSFMSGVFLLSASTLMVKIIGLAYKIPMMNILGAQGMGYFNSAYEIYAMLCVISTAGLPVALSMMVSARAQSQDEPAVKRVYRTALMVFVTLGAVGSAILWLFARDLSSYIENPDAYGCILAISPALFCVCISSAVRGYFQGRSKMLPTALSQLIEAGGKLVFGILFAIYAIRQGYAMPYVAAYAVMGLSLGTLLSALYLLAVKLIDGKRGRADSDRAALPRERGIAKRLLQIAIPITLGSAVLSLTRVVDMTLIMKRLQDIGYSSAGANKIYGSYTTMALPVFSLIPSLITPVALALVPRLTAALEAKDRETEGLVVRSSMRLTSLFAIPSAVGVAVYAENILELLFNGQREAIDISAPLLALLGISIFFSCLITTTNAVLQSYSQTTKPIIAMGVGTVVKAISAYLLIGNASVGVLGAPFSTLLCDITITAINLYYVNKYVPESDSVGRLYGRPFIAALSMICVSFAVYMATARFGFENRAAFVFAMAAAIPSYLFFALVYGAVGKEDILMMPYGEKILSFMCRFGVFGKVKDKKN